MEGFYGNIGGKIKKAAFLWAVLGIIGSVGCGVMIWLGFGHFLGVYGYNGAIIFFTGLIWAVVGSLFAYFSSWLLYAFGTMVENLQIIADTVSANPNAVTATRTGSAGYTLSGLASSMLHNAANQAEAEAKSAAKPTGCWVCKNCKTLNSNTTTFCKDCGQIK